MKIHFYSFQDSECIESYVTEATFTDNGYMFKDKSMENTVMHITPISSKEVKFLRNGDVFMEASFILNHRTKAFYKNDLGLSFEFEVDTKEIIVKENQIMVQYDYYFDNELLSKIKIILLIK